MSGFGALAIAASGEEVRVENVAVSFNEPGGTEVLVWFDAPSEVRLDVFARDIADGDLACTLGPRRAAVRMDLRLAMRIVTEGLRAGLMAPAAETGALRAVLAAAEKDGE